MADELVERYVQRAMKAEARVEELEAQAAKSPAQIAIDNGYYAQRAMKAEARVEELEALLREWRNAKLAIFERPGVESVADHAARWFRLAAAETAAFAVKLKD